MVSINKKEIADLADVIIDGYAIHKKEDGRVSVVNLNRDGHAVIFLPNGEIDESSMDDIENVIAFDYYNKARKYMEPNHAEVL